MDVFHEAIMELIPLVVNANKMFVAREPFSSSFFNSTENCSAAGNIAFCKESILRLERLYGSFDQLKLVKIARALICDHLLPMSPTSSSSSSSSVANIDGAVGGRDVNLANFVQRKGLEPVRQEIIREIRKVFDELVINEESVIAALTEQQLHKAKKQKLGPGGGNNFFSFNFDDMAPFEPLEDTLHLLRQNPTDSIALEKLYKIDINDLFEHPQWMDLLSLLEKALYAVPSSSSTASPTSNTTSITPAATPAIKVMGIYLRFLESLQNQQAVDIIKKLLEYFWVEWIDGRKLSSITALVAERTSPGQHPHPQQPFDAELYALRSSTLQRVQIMTFKLLLYQAPAHLTVCLEKDRDSIIAMIFLLLSYGKQTLRCDASTGACTTGTDTSVAAAVTAAKAGYISPHDTNTTYIMDALLARESITTKDNACNANNGNRSNSSTGTADKDMNLSTSIQSLVKSCHPICSLTHAYHSGFLFCASGRLDSIINILRTGRDASTTRISSAACEYNIKAFVSLSKLYLSLFEYHADNGIIKNKLMEKSTNTAGIAPTDADQLLLWDGRLNPSTRSIYDGLVTMDLMPGMNKKFSQLSSASSSSAAASSTTTATSTECATDECTAASIGSLVTLSKYQQKSKQLPAAAASKVRSAIITTAASSSSSPSPSIFTSTTSSRNCFDALFLEIVQTLEYLCSVLIADFPPVTTTRTSSSSPPAAAAEGISSSYSSSRTALLPLPARKIFKLLEECNLPALLLSLGLHSRGLSLDSFHRTAQSLVNIICVVGKLCTNALIQETREKSLSTRTGPATTDAGVGCFHGSRSLIQFWASLLSAFTKYMNVALYDNSGDDGPCMVYISIIAEIARGIDWDLLLSHAPTSAELSVIELLTSVLNYANGNAAAICSSKCGAQSSTGTSAAWCISSSSSSDWDVFSAFCTRFAQVSLAYCSRVTKHTCSSSSSSSTSCASSSSCASPPHERALDVIYSRYLLVAGSIQCLHTYDDAGVPLISPITLFPSFPARAQLVEWLVHQLTGSLLLSIAQSSSPFLDSMASESESPAVYALLNLVSLLPNSQEHLLTVLSCELLAQAVHAADCDPINTWEYASCSFASSTQSTWPFMQVFNFFTGLAHMGKGVFAVLLFALGWPPLRVALSRAVTSSTTTGALRTAAGATTTTTTATSTENSNELLLSPSAVCALQNFRCSSPINTGSISTASPAVQVLAPPSAPIPAGAEEQLASHVFSLTMALLSPEQYDSNVLEDLSGETLFPFLLRLLNVCLEEDTCFSRCVFSKSRDISKDIIPYNSCTTMRKRKGNEMLSQAEEENDGNKEHQARFATSPSFIPGEITSSAAAAAAAAASPVAVAVAPAVFANLGSGDVIEPISDEMEEEQDSIDEEEEEKKATPIATVGVDMYELFRMEQTRRHAARCGGRMNEYIPIILLPQTEKDLTHNISAAVYDPHLSRVDCDEDVKSTTITYERSDTVRSASSHPIMFNSSFLKSSLSERMHGIAVPFLKDISIAGDEVSLSMLYQVVKGLTGVSSRSSSIGAVNCTSSIVAKSMVPNSWTEIIQTCQNTCSEYPQRRTKQLSPEPRFLSEGNDNGYLCLCVEAIVSHFCKGVYAEVLRRVDVPVRVLVQSTAASQFQNYLSGADASMVACCIALNTRRFTLTGRGAFLDRSHSTTVGTAASAAAAATLENVVTPIGTTPIGQDSSSEGSGIVRDGSADGRDCNMFLVLALSSVIICVAQRISAEQQRDSLDEDDAIRTGTGSEYISHILKTVLIRASIDHHHHHHSNSSSSNSSSITPLAENKQQQQQQKHSNGGRLLSLRDNILPIMSSLLDGDAPWFVQ